MAEQRLAALAKIKEEKIMTRFRIYLTCALLFFIALACAMPSLPMNQSVFNTSVAQTVNAGLTQGYVSPTFTQEATLTPMPTLTQELLETLAPTTTITPTFPFIPTDSSTMSVVLSPQLVVTVNTNCRTGTDKIYAVEGTLLAGESAEVVGVDPTGKYWYIRNPDPGAKYCWISGKYANFVGSTSLVLVLTPAPTPTSTITATPVPKFRMAYLEVDECENWWADINFQNTGAIAFKSIKITVEDAYSTKKHTSITDGFIDLDGCAGSTKIESLESGEIVTVSAPAFPFKLTRRLNVTATLCSEPGMKGVCDTESFWFNP
jgi:hypothetical protein